MNRFFLAILLPALGLAACHKPVSPQTPAPAIGNNCAPRTCTMQYDPVCATIKHNGIEHEQTFSNTCMVCTQVGSISAIRQGACGADVQ